MKKPKYLLEIAASIFIICMTGLYVQQEASVANELSVYGETTLGTIVDKETKSYRRDRGRQRIEYHYNVQYSDSHTKWFKLQKEYSVGHRLHITYSSQNPEVARLIAGRPQSTSFWTLVKDQYGLYVLIAVVVIFVFGTLERLFKSK